MPRRRPDTVSAPDRLAATGATAVPRAAAMALLFATLVVAAPDAVAQGGAPPATGGGPPAGAAGSPPPGAGRGGPPRGPARDVTFEAERLTPADLSRRDAAGVTRLAGWRTGVRLPLPPLVRRGGRTLLLQTLSAERWDLDYTPSGAAAAPAPDVLWRIGYGALLSQAIGRGAWRATAGVQVAATGDLQDFDAEQLQLTGQLLATRRASPSLEWGVGAAWINIGPRLVPAVLLRWRDGTRQYLELLPPQKLEYGRTLARGLDVGLGGRLAGGRFRQGDPDARAQPVIDLVDGIVGPWVGVTTGPVSLRVDGGWAVFRRYRLRDEAGAAPARRLDADGTPTLRATLRLSY